MIVPITKNIYTEYLKFYSYNLVSIMYYNFMH